MENRITETARDFELWEKQMARRKQLWQAELLDREHERLMRESVQADTGRAA